MIAFSSLMIALLIFIGFFTGFTPFFNRSSQFGVTLPKKYLTSEFVKKQQKKFLWVNSCASLILVIPIFYFMMGDSSQQAIEWISFYLIAAIAILFIISGLLFLGIRKKIIHFKEELPVSELNTEHQNIIVDTTYRQSRLIVPSSFIFITNIVIIALVVGITLMNYERIPDKIVTNWNVNMEPDQITGKSILTVLFIPILQVYMMAVFYISNYSYQKAKQKVDASQPEVSIEKNRAFRYAMSVFTFIVSVVLQLFLGFIQFIMIFNWMDKMNFPLIITLFLAVLLLATVYLAFKYGQSGERFKGKMNQASSVETVSGYDEDSNWKLGVFYFNSKDPSIWVEKRFGIGVTMNMARWQSWAFFTLIIAVPILITVLFI